VADGTIHLVAGVGDYLRTCDGVDAAPSGLTPLHLLLLHSEVNDALAHSTGLEERVILREMFGDDKCEEDICSQSRLKGSESGATSLCGMARVRVVLSGT